MKYFYDSYVVIEYLGGNQTYKQYFEENEGILISMNLLEIHHSLLKNFSEPEADNTINLFWSFINEPNAIDIISASKFKLAHKKRNLSYIDCIDYVMAKRIGIKFLTGDKEFNGFDNVEYIK